MKKSIVLVLTLVLVLTFSALAVSAEDAVLYTATGSVSDEAEFNAVAGEVATDNTTSTKAIAAAITIAIAATAGAVAMGMAICKAVDGIARQPEADGKIRTSLMLGLVFVETAIIYALIVAILIIFVL